MFLLGVQTNLLSETSPFLSAQMTVLSIFFQMFVVLGMYKIGYDSSTKEIQIIHRLFLVIAIYCRATSMNY